ncbi:MAG: ATP-binding cassette domain-containing protein [Syntrophomonas sp.]
MEICRLEKVCKSFMTGEKVCPLQNVDLVVNAGDLISIEGSSGIGKSTLLYVMGSLLKVDEGKLYLDKKDVSLMNDQELTRLRAEKIGFIFQDTNLIQALTLQENLEFTRSLGKKRRVDAGQVLHWLERLGLSERKDFLPYQLSGGQRRRAMVARALINRPALVLADEPTNDLDDFWAHEVVQLFLEAKGQGSAVVIVTHNNKWTKEASLQYRLEAGKLELVEAPYQ